VIRTVWVWLALASLLTSADAAAQGAAAPQPTVSIGESGVTIQSQNGDFQLRFGTLIQADGRFAVEDEAERLVDSFNIRRLRPTLRGRVARRFEFYLNPDFAGGTLVVQDAYLDAVFSPAFRIRVGKGKAPFGLERLQSAAQTLFAERALPSVLAPNRDIGIQVLGEAMGGVVIYQGALMNGVADGGSADLDPTDGKDVIGRILIKPFRRRPPTHPLHGLAVGVSGTIGLQSGILALPAMRVQSPQPIFFAYLGAAADGTRTRYSPQGIFTYKWFSALAEYVHTEVPIASATARADIAHRAWQVAGAVVLTGEAATDGSTGLRPRATFDFSQRHWGAIQLAARYHRLEVDEAARRLGLAAPGSSLEADSWTVGVNWFATPNLRYLFDVERTVFDGNTAGSRPAENTLLFRSQIAF
jgi:phosphate-selective porin OprO and OprP